MPAQPVRRAFGFVGGFLALFFVLAFVMAFLRAGKGSTGFLPGTSVVAVVPLEGEIERSDDFVETLADLQEDQRYAAVVVRIDSPGGAVAPSQEMYEAVRRLREKKPVIASLGSVAASGGYYVASAADTIVASPGTLTGSIGVIMSLTNVRGLMDKLGVEATIVTAGKWKDTGSPFRAVTPEERAMLQKMADQVHTQFIDAVAAGRKLDPAKAREIANGPRSVVVAGAVLRGGRVAVPPRQCPRDARFARPARRRGNRGERDAAAPVAAAVRDRGIPLVIATPPERRVRRTQDRARAVLRETT